MRGLLGESRRESELGPLRRWIQAREGALAAAWIAGVVLLFAFLFAWGVWARGAERLIDWWDARSTRRLATCEALVSEQRWSEAVVELEALDASHPAIFVKHGLDKERERVLELLGKCWIELDKKRKATETFERLVAFDPRNWRNHWLLAECLRGFSDSDAAELEYREVLRLHPNHLPTVETLTGMLFDVATLYAKVVELHEQYIDAFLMAEVVLEVGGREVSLDVQADGRPHRLEMPLELPADWSGTVTLATHGWSVRVGALAFVPPLRVGESGASEPEVFADAAAWSASGASALDGGRFAAEGPGSALTLAARAPRGAAAVRLELTVYKAMTEETWTKIVISYRNKLRFEALDAAQARTVVGGCLEAGSTFEN